MITVTEIKNTQAYNDMLCKTAQMAVVQKTNRKKIAHGIILAKNLGFDEWVRIESPDSRVRNIVKELSTN